MVAPASLMPFDPPEFPPPATSDDDSGDDVPATPLGQLVRLVYSSQTSTPPDPLVVDGILTASRRANRAAGLSGLLVHHLTHYMQCLEGTPAAVQATFDRITRDPRHHHVVTHYLEPVEDRAFGSWFMAYAAVGNSAWTMLERVDWAASDVATPGLSRGFVLLERVWDLYRNTRQANRGPPDE